ncbi:MAG: dTMP kinase [Planctomycetes bacterium]|nr:dTMP kinase [Planctomycetota bacterium]
MEVAVPKQFLFIDFEGIDGSGKTTLSNRIADLLREQGYRVEHVRDKGVFRSEVSKAIRKLSRDPRMLRMGDMTELLLYVARDAQMVDEFIIPRMREGTIIFADRYFHSSIAHSHFARGMDRDLVQRILDDVARGIWPDLIVYSDVDSLTSRVRKRIQKIHDRRVGDFGRKGLMGIGFRERMREGFLRMAQEDPARWIAIDNARNTLDESVRTIYGRIAEAMEAKGFPPPRPIEGAASAAARVSVGDLSSADGPEQAVPRRFYEILSGYADDAPGLAGFYVNKLDSDEAYGIRDRIVDREPDLVAYGLNGLTSPRSIEYRQRLIEITPFWVMRSLGGIRKAPEAFVLRRRALDAAPEQVALSLRGVDLPEAWEMRRYLLKEEKRAVLSSLRGIDTPDAWKLRERYMKKKNRKAIAESLAGIDTDQAWELRRELEETVLPWVLISLRGLTSDRAWEMRARYIDRAPKSVIRSIGRKDDPRAWELRERAKTYCKEVLDSVGGLDSERAWALRHELCDRWPNTAVSSLGAGNQSERAWKFRWQQMDRHPENLLLVKHIVKALLRKEREEREDEADEGDED